ncbi:MAG: HEAT repeat domain-containing protein [Cyanobacteria bacterium P01_D01_bin.156]
MIWRSTLVFLTSLAAFTVSVENLQAKAEDIRFLLAQSSLVDPNAAVDTGQAVPNFNQATTSQNSPLVQEQREEIKTLQQELSNRGYYHGPIDGIYGPGTEAAVQKLRGQTGNIAAPTSIPSTLGSPEPLSEPTAPASADASPNIDSGSINSEIDSGSINSEDGNPVSDDAQSENDAEPAENLDNDAETTENFDAEPVPPPTRPSPMLWAGLAVLAALGSFGIGFILVNRSHGHDEEEEASWGIPTDISSLNNNSREMAASNGHGLPQEAHHRNGPHGLAVASSTAKPTTLPPDNVSVMPISNGNGGLSTTTRLAQVDVIDELVANLQVADPAKRRKAIWELGQRGNSSAVHHLVNNMVDTDSKEKSLILAALSEIGIRSLKPMSRALAIALQDENPDVRKNAIRDLTRVYDLVTQISQMLGHATEDEDPEVRRTAEWAMGQLNRIREAPKLSSAVNKNGLDASHASSELLPGDMENLKN